MPREPDLAYDNAYLSPFLVVEIENRKVLFVDIKKDNFDAISDPHSWQAHSINKQLRSIEISFVKSSIPRYSSVVSDIPPFVWLFSALFE